MGKLIVYGADICRDCLAMKKIFADRKVEYDYVDFISSTAKMRQFFVIRDHADIYENTRNKEGGGIGIPLFVMDDRMSFDINDALKWVNQEPISLEDYEAIATKMDDYIALKNQIANQFKD